MSEDLHSPPPEILGVLGHDLRNPLSAISALSTLTLRRSDLPEPLRARLALIKQAATRALELTGTLLAFSESRSQRGLAIAPVAGDLADISRGAVDELRAAHPDRAIELVAAGDCRCECDPARLAQVVSNLVGNALAHGSAHEPVRVAVTGQDSAVSLEVINHGPAISAELVPSLFEPFRRGPATPDRPGGLGLGLYIVREIVTAHRGAVTVDSVEGKTRFRVQLPRALSWAG